MTAVHRSAGTPDGGQFAPTGRAESEISFTLDDVSDYLLAAADAQKLGGQDSLTAEQHAAADEADAQAERDADAVIREREETARYGTDTNAMPMLSLDEHPWVRAALAKNPAIPAHLMHRLTEDPAPVVRLAAAEHSHRLYDLDRLCEDPDLRVRQQAVKTYASVSRKAALEKAQWGETTVKYGTRTPWGAADDIVHVAPGIANVGTPSHGGMKLSAQRNKQVHPAWRQPGGWYEEDCAAAIVRISFPEAFPASHQEESVRSAKNYFPDQYEQVTGTKLVAGESRARDRQTFDTDHANDHVVTSASRSDAHPGMVEVTAKVGGRASACPDPEKRFLVSSPEYAARSEHGFVIDPARHAELTD